MIKQSYRLYFIFYWILTGSITALIFQVFAVAMLGKSAEMLAWMNAAIYVAAFFNAALMFTEKIPGVLKFFGGLFASEILFIGIHTLNFSVLKLYSLYGIEMGYFVAISAGVFIINILLAVLFHKYLHRISFILENESTFEKKELFVTWAREQLGGSIESPMVKKYVGTVTLFAALFIILCFIALAANPQAKYLLSLSFVLFAVSAFGAYLILNQLNSIIQWKMSEYPITGKFLKSWNRLIGLLLIPIILIPIAIPWDYKIVDAKDLNQFLSENLKGITLNVSQSQPKVTVLSNDAASLSNRLTNTTVTIVENDQYRKDAEFRMRVLVIAFYTVVGLAGLYVLLGIVGGIMYVGLRYKKRGKVAQFFINRYMKMRGLLTAIAGFFVVFFKFFLSLFGFRGFGGKEQEKDISKEISQMLYAMFKANEEMTDEKKEEILTIVKQFVALIQITGRYVTPYRFYQGPLEYIHLVIQNKPELKKSLLKIVDIFNESRYSLHLLTLEKKAMYEKTINFVITMITEPSKEV